MENMRGALFMVFAMGCFAVEDAIFKFLTSAIPVGQLMSVACLGGLILFLLWFKMKRIALWQTEYLDNKVIWRSLFDVAGGLCFVTALSRIPLTTASAVIQATPLVVAMGAALFLGQTVGWRRWLAIAIGFLGVMVIIRPGLAGFDANILFAVAGMLCLAVRDVITRALTVSLSGAQLATHTFAMIFPAGLLLCAVQGDALVLPDFPQTGLLAASVIVGMVAYLALVAATRGGNAGMISSFRYSRMIFALIIGFAVFREIPDLPTVIGAGIVISSGLFTLWREARLLRASHPNEPKL